MKQIGNSNIGMSEVTRRGMLKMTAAGAAALVGGGRLLEAAEGGKPFGISVQLYSVRGDCKADFDKALEQIAKMGFQGVEFAGYYNYANKGEQLRKRLDDLGLKAAGTHIRTDSFRGDAIKNTIAFHKAIGCRFLIVPGDKAFCDKEKSKELAETFNQAAAALKPEGMYCGYHNHSREFGKAEGDKTWWDLFAERTDKDVMLQQDVGWSTAAGADAAAYIRRYPGRSKILHFKTHVQGADQAPIIGRDSVKWKEVIKACRDVGGTEWATIEQERYIKGKSPMECTQMSLAGLKAILKEMG